MDDESIFPDFYFFDCFDVENGFEEAFFFAIFEEGSFINSQNLSPKRLTLR
jgi:hypothetical protein